MNRVIFLGIPVLLMAALFVLPITASGLGGNEVAETGIQAEKPVHMSNCCGGGGSAEMAKVRIEMSRTTCLQGSESEAIQVKCVVNDPEAGENLEYHWAAEAGRFENPTGAANTWYPPAEAGKFNLVCEVTNGDGWDARVESDKVRVTKYQVKSPAKAPEFAAERLVGDGEVSLADYAGQVVMVNWWATW